MKISNAVEDDAALTERTRLCPRLFQLISQAKQLSVLRFWEQLSPFDRESLTEQLKQVDWDFVSGQSSRDSIVHAVQDLAGIEPPRRLIRLPQTSAELSTWEAARSEGRRLLRLGKIGVILVAGGAGTRLGFHQPKGMFPIGPVTDRSLFQIFSEQVLSLNRRFGIQIPMLIMTSDSTHADTVNYFERSNWFGLNPQDLLFFQQGWQPAFDLESGQMLLAEKGSLVASADGHGGLLAAMNRAGLFGELRRRHIETLFYHQVDNPLIHICDPAFLGFHSLHQSQVSTKFVRKSEANEKVGVIAEINGRAQIIEYSDLAADMAAERNSCGQLRLCAGNTAIHVFERDFLEAIAKSSEGLPWHDAVKNVPFVDEFGIVICPDKPNALKFERFIFDVLPLAQTALAVETDRATEFAPLKNAEGNSSPQEVRRAMISVAIARLRAQSITVPDGIGVEISPLAVQPDEGFTLRAGIQLPSDEDWVMGVEHLQPLTPTLEAASSSPYLVVEQ